MSVMEHSHWLAPGWPGDGTATDDRPPGLVTLVGAGPGDPELLTLKAVKAISAATVLLVDDLVSDGVLAHARPGARIVHVGKRGGCKSTPQAFIEKLMVMAAREGEMVVRLKGGDPFIFGRGGEEVEHLREALAQAPLPIWRETEGGEVVWANSAYMLKAIGTIPAGKELGWPLPRLFERVASQSTARGQRAAVKIPDEDIAWYDLIGTASGTERLVFALPADAAVMAAAVADWRVANAAGSKLKKDGSGRAPALEFAENPDILATVAQSARQSCHRVLPLENTKPWNCVMAARAIWAKA